MATGDRSPTANVSLGGVSVHPEYALMANDWKTLRDCVLGATEVKKNGERYLMRPDGMNQAVYAAYISRAVFFNMVARTIIGLNGTLFRRPAKPVNFPEKFTKNLETISNYGMPLESFVKQTAMEVFTVGRYGVLLDMDAAGKRPPYMTGYVAENIIDWTETEIDGRMVLTEVILRELTLERGEARMVGTVTATRGSLATSKMWTASYRALRLELNPETGKWEYSQYIYKNPGKDAYMRTVGNNVATSPMKVTPNRRGVPFDFIPFVFFGPNDNKPRVDKSPMVDIAHLNLSHYDSSAQLEHGRFYTAQPVYYVSRGKASDGEAEYTLGPSTVWELPEDGSAGLLEFHGAGLMFLEHALKEKEEQLSTLGGRMAAVDRAGPGQSDSKSRMQEVNEAALMLNVSYTIDSGFTQLLRWWLMWMEASEADITATLFATNKSFILSMAAAREFRAIQMMYEAGVIPIQVLYDYMVKAEVIPEDMSLETFMELLNDPDNFPHQADISAQMEGAPDAKTKWETEHPQSTALQQYGAQRKPTGGRPRKNTPK